MTSLDQNSHTREFLAVLLHELTNAEAHKATGIAHRDDLDCWQAQTVFDAAAAVAARRRDQGHPDTQLAVSDVFNELRDQGHLEKEPMRAYWITVVSPPAIPPAGRHRIRFLASRLAEDHFRRVLEEINYKSKAHTAPLRDLTAMLDRDYTKLREIYSRVERRPDLTIIDRKGA